MRSVIPATTGGLLQTEGMVERQMTMECNTNNQLLHKPPEIQSTHAILKVSSRYALQLRDDIPTIAAPGQWSLFGGMRKKNETPFQSIQREIEEELAIRPELTYLWFIDYFSEFEKMVIRTWFFVSEVSGVWNRHILSEGKAAGVYSFEEIHALSMPRVMRDAIIQYHTQSRIKNENKSGNITGNKQTITD